MTLLEQRVRKECRNIKLTETAWGLDNDPTPLVQSKVLGAPFFPAAYADDYPRGERGILRGAKRNVMLPFLCKSVCCFDK